MEYAFACGLKCLFSVDKYVLSIFKYMCVNCEFYDYQ